MEDPPRSGAVPGDRPCGSPISLRAVPPIAMAGSPVGEVPVPRALPPRRRRGGAAQTSKMIISRRAMLFPAGGGGGRSGGVVVPAFLPRPPVAAAGRPWLSGGRVTAG
eukprot:gene17620-biopygen8960